MADFLFARARALASVRVNTHCMSFDQIVVNVDYRRTQNTQQQMQTISIGEGDGHIYYIPMSRHAAKQRLNSALCSTLHQANDNVERVRVRLPLVVHIQHLKPPE